MIGVLLFLRDVVATMEDHSPLKDERYADGTPVKRIDGAIKYEGCWMTLGNTWSSQLGTYPNKNNPQDPKNVKNPDGTPKHFEYCLNRETGQLMMMGDWEEKYSTKRPQ